MFYFLFSNPNLLVWLLLSFFLFLTFRKIFIHRTVLVVIYHLSLFLLLFTLEVGGGGVQNDGYQRLEQFISLEKNNQLQHAKNNPQEYDGLFQIDLQQFKNSSDFKEYLQENNFFLDKIEVLFISWFLALMTDLSMALVGRAQRKKTLSTKLSSKY